MKHPFKLLVIGFLAACIGLSCSGGSGAGTETLSQFAASRSPEKPLKKDELHDAMRKLWEDHITWTRLFIVSAVAGLADEAPTAGRLLQNQVDIGNLFKPFYGEEAGADLTTLLTEHITTAAEIVHAALQNDAEALADAIERWYANGEAIAAFLSGLNPKDWPFEEMDEMMEEHLDLTTEELEARLAGDYAADIAAYEKVHEQALQMADMLTSGLR